jgi:hypothetical protein
MGWRTIRTIPTVYDALGFGVYTRLTDTDDTHGLEEIPPMFCSLTPAPVLLYFPYPVIIFPSCFLSLHVVLSSFL